MGKFTKTLVRPGTEKFDPTSSYRIYEPQPLTVPPPEIQLVPIINKTLTQCVGDRKPPYLPPTREAGKRATFVVHPSQASGCRRKVFFVVIDAQKDRRPPDPDMERMFAMGHQAHQRIQGYFFEAWRRKVGGVTRVWEDVKLKILGLGVSGELDLIVEIGGHRYLVEIKTASANVYKNTLRPKLDWIWQTHLYMEAMGLSAAILLMECRNDGKMRQFYIPRDELVMSEIEDGTWEVLASVEGEVVPEKTDDRGECYWCPYTEICKSKAQQAMIDYDRVRLPMVA